jgi:O-antigen/teichoic acid export membrane protein
MQHSVRYNVAWSMTAVIVKNGFYIATYMLLARLLAPTAFGLIAITMVGMGLASSFVDSGFTSVVVRQERLDRNALSSLYWFNVVLGIAAAGLLALSGPLVATLYHEPRLARMLFTTAAALFFASWGQQFLSILQRQLAFRRIAAIEISSAAIAFVVSALRAFSGAGPLAYFEGLTVGIFFSTVAAIISARSIFFPTFRFRLQEVRPLFGFGTYNTGERLITYAAFNLEKPLMGRLFNLEVLGLYTIVSQMVTRPIFLFSNAVSRVAYPVYADLQNDHSALNNSYLRYIGRISLVTFPIYGFLYLFPETIISFLFGDRFLPACGYVFPLCILGAIWSIGNPFGAYLMALNKAKVGFYFNVFNVCLTLGIFLVGSRYPMPAMLWIWTAAVAAILMPLEWYTRYRLTKMSPVKYLLQVAPHALVVVLLCSATVFVRHWLPRGSGLSTDAILMPACVALYGAYGLLMFRFYRVPERG